MLNHWDQLKSHQEQRELFRRSIQQGRLSHAYMLVGPAGIGKMQFARLLAMSVFCREHSLEELQACGECRACRGFLANTWPDYSEIGLPTEKSVIPISAIVGDDNQRGRSGLCYDLSMAPQASERRVAVIDDAGHMSPEGANALLKTLEEPPADSLILLICDNPDTLLPTIRSRCQAVRFFPLPDSDVQQILIDEEMTESESDAQAVAGLCEGSLQTAQQLLDPELRKLKNAVARGILQLEQMQPLQLAGSAFSSIEEISSSTAEQRQNAQWLLRFVADALRARLKGLASGDLSDPLSQRIGAREGTDLLAPMLHRTIEASMQIDGISPLKLVLESLFDDLARLCRTTMKRR